MCACVQINLLESADLTRIPRTHTYGAHRAPHTPHLCLASVYSKRVLIVSLQRLFGYIRRCSQMKTLQIFTQDIECHFRFPLFHISRLVVETCAENFLENLCLLTVTNSGRVRCYEIGICSQATECSQCLQIFNLRVLVLH